MITFMRCRPEHLVLVKPQAMQAAETAVLLSPAVLASVESTIAISGFVGARCVGCAGIVDVADGTSLVWAYLSVEAGPYMLAITRKVRRVLDAHPAVCVEATVANGFAAGVRWVEALGFVKVADRADRPYFPRGFGAALYQRKRHVWI